MDPCGLEVDGVDVGPWTTIWFGPVAVIVCLALRAVVQLRDIANVVVVTEDPGAMVEQPAGVVTFLFSDIEGSTRLLHELGPERYREALAEHRRLLRGAFARHGGYEVDYEGDAFFVAFADAGSAVMAASEARAALAGGSIVVRMGLHTGEPLLDPPKYVGVDVHLAARVMSAGHGGQVLLTATTRELVDVQATELGEHRLKDMDAPVPLFQLGSERFPPLKTISNTNLPRPAASFVGREAEVAEVVALVRESRLATLTGPGGTGKTRLAIEAAAELVPEFKAGVFWVGLATLRDPALVTETIAQTLGAKGELAAHVGEREMLLLLDNFEQVVDAAPDLSTLLEACPNLRLLVTSRELLRVRGEAEFPVLPLADPEAIELFGARTRLAPDETIAELCRRLDNLPLAVELAAARTSVLTPAQILDRIGQRLDLLKGGRDADPRQQTLRATIEWSHDLLTPDEQQLFARLAVFAGGCTLEAAEHVADADLDTLQSLVDKSLVRHTGERFWMLETIRAYAAERLDRLTEATAVAERHAGWYLDLSERMERASFEGDFPGWHIFDEELDNVRGALARGRDSPEVALRLVVTLVGYWNYRGRAREGLAHATGALEDFGKADAGLRARALLVISDLAGISGENQRALSAAREAVAILRERGDQRLLGRSLRTLGNQMTRSGALEEAGPTYAEAVAILRELDEPGQTAAALIGLVNIELIRGNWQHARQLSRETLEIFREAGWEHGVAVSLGNLGGAALGEGKLDEAERLYSEALEIARNFDPELVAVCLTGIAATEAVGNRLEAGAETLGLAEAVWDAVEAEPQGYELEVLTRATSELTARRGPAPLLASRERGRHHVQSDPARFGLPASVASDPTP